MNSDQSIASQITKLKRPVDAKKVDFIFMGSYAPGGASATKQIRAAGINLPIIGGAGFDGTFWLGAVPNLKNFYVVAGGVTTGGDPEQATRRRLRGVQEEVQEGRSARRADAERLQRRRTRSLGRSSGRSRPTAPRSSRSSRSSRTSALPIGNITWTSKCHISKLRSLPIITFVGTKEKFVAEVAPKVSILPKTLC